MPSHKTFIKELYAAYERGDIIRILGSLAGDVEWTCFGPESVPFCGTFRGQVSVAKFFDVLETTQTDQKLTIEETRVVGNQVIALGRYTCLVKATQKRMDTKVLQVFTVKGGRVVRFMDFVDTDEVLEAYTPTVASTAQPALIKLG